MRSPSIGLWGRPGEVIRLRLLRPDVGLDSHTIVVAQGLTVTRFSPSGKAAVVLFSGNGHLRDFECGRGNRAPQFEVVANRFNALEHVQ